ncbi:protein of unknown function (plasmid) [Caballeronia sp. S22]
MRMKSGLHARHQLVHARVNKECSRLGLAFAVDDIAVEVADQQTRRGDLAERITIGVHEEQIVVARHHRGKVIADTLFEAVQRREPKTGGKLAARLGDLGGVEPGGNGCNALRRIGKRMSHMSVPLVMCLTEMSRIIDRADG